MRISDWSSDVCSSDLGLSSLLRGKRFSRNTRRRSESFALLKDTRLIMYIISMIKRADSIMPYVSHEFPQRRDVQSGQRGRKCEHVQTKPWRAPLKRSGGQGKDDRKSKRLNSSK